MSSSLASMPSARASSIDLRQRSRPPCSRSHHSDWSPPAQGVQRRGRTCPALPRRSRRRLARRWRQPNRSDRWRRRGTTELLPATACGASPITSMAMAKEAGQRPTCRHCANGVEPSGTASSSGASPHRTTGRGARRCTTTIAVRQSPRHLLSPRISDLKRRRLSGRPSWRRCGRARGACPTASPNDLGRRHR